MALNTITMGEILLTIKWIKKMKKKSVNMNERRSIS